MSEDQEYKKAAECDTLERTIERSLGYHSLARKILMLDETYLHRKPNEPVVHYHDTDRPFYKVCPVGVVARVEGNKCHFPIIETSGTRQFPARAVTDMHSYVVDRQIRKIKEVIEYCENHYLVQGLINIATLEKKVLEVDELMPQSLREAFLVLEQENKCVYNMIVSPKQFSRLLVFGKDFMDYATVREQLTTKLFGHVWTANVYVSTSVPEDTMLFTVSGDETGVFIPVGTVYAHLVSEGDTAEYEYSSSFAMGLYGDSVCMFKVNKKQKEI